MLQFLRLCIGAPLLVLHATGKEDTHKEDGGNHEEADRHDHKEKAGSK